MNFQQILQTLGERIQGNAGIHTMYGAPIVLEGKTLIPVGRLAFGFGASRAPGQYGTANNAAADEGTGMGGGIVAHPIGMMEVTPTRTRFIPCRDHSRIVLGLILGIFLGVWLRGRR